MTSRRVRTPHPNPHWTVHSRSFSLGIAQQLGFPTTPLRLRACSMLKQPMLKGFVIATAALLAAGSAFASRIADPIDARWQFESFDQQTSYVAGRGVEDPTWRPSVSLDIDSSSITVDRIGDGTSQAASTLWTFSDLDGSV